MVYFNLLTKSCPRFGRETVYDLTVTLASSLMAQSWTARSCELKSRGTRLEATHEYELTNRNTLACVFACKFACAFLALFGNTDYGATDGRVSEVNSDFLY